MRALLLSAAAAVRGPPVAAQDVAITNARLVIGDGSAPIEGGTVVVRGGKIVAAGAGVAVPAGIERVDAGGHWVTPGIVAAFSRVGLVEVDAVAGQQRPFGPPFALFGGVSTSRPGAQPDGLARRGQPRRRRHPRDRVRRATAAGCLRARVRSSIWATTMTW